MKKRATTTRIIGHQIPIGSKNIFFLKAKNAFFQMLPSNTKNQ